MSATSELERDPASARADIEYRLVVLSGEFAPQLDVLGVGAALEVMPDHAHGRAAPSCAQNCATCPRAESTSRSSSSAV